MPHRKQLEFNALRGPLESLHGRKYWRCLEELAETDEFQQLLLREFPQQASEWSKTSSRREFLKLMGASLALAGLNGCVRSPEEKIVPYVRQPEEIVPGKPLYFATAMPQHGAAMGLLVESHMGRPTKIEGNPDHPASLGATDVFAQAEILTLYDPDRSQTVLNGGQIDSWDSCLTVLKARMDAQRNGKGSGLRILTETVVSPTLIHQLQSLLQQFPSARWYQYEPVQRDNVRAGADSAFGTDVDMQYHFDRADVVLSLDADFLTSGPGHVRHARDFMHRRRISPSPTAKSEINRLYVVESTPTTTGAVADHRLSLRPSRIEAFARAVASRLGIDVEPPSSDSLRGIPVAWLDAVVADLKKYRLEHEPGASLVIAGDSQPAIVHALSHAMNDAFRSVGETVVYTEPISARSVNQTAQLRELIQEMEAGRVETLIVLGGNPVFTAPADFNFADALGKVPFALHLSLYVDETSTRCQWHVPDSHFLESWSDARAFDGTTTVVQPLIAPLYNSKTAHEVMATLLGQPSKTSHEIVQSYWKQRLNRPDFDDVWQKALNDGLFQGNRAAVKRVALRRDFGKRLGQNRTANDHPEAVEIVFRPDPTIGDGRFANNGWLQELPKPLTKLTWDNAAVISLATAKAHGLTAGDVIELRRGKNAVELPIWILPGHPDQSVTVHFGYGRTNAGRVGNGTGVNVYPLRSSDAMWFAIDGQLRKTDRRYELAATDKHHLANGRELVRAGTIDEVRAHPERPAFMTTAHEPGKNESLFPSYEYAGYKWGMSVNMGACIGCNACVIACQAENNSPVVGKEQVSLGREMHWLRIDTYYEGAADEQAAAFANPATYFQPVPCMHCENAPCELVCPVAATVHSDEGLNQMVYNRCVGTRYCSNNCPYKVRRFNFLQFADYETPVLKLLNNPDVTVRSRGVMEKCTYCVQRINEVRINAEKENRQIRDGEVVTACQQACPTQAIIFGNLNDSKSELRQLIEQPLNYALLAELNTRPRTTYLAAVRNPNPALSQEDVAD